MSQISRKFGNSCHDIRESSCLIARHHFHSANKLSAQNWRKFQVNSAIPTRQEINIRKCETVIIKLFSRFFPSLIALQFRQSQFEHVLGDKLIIYVWERKKLLSAILARRINSLIYPFTNTSQALVRDNENNLSDRHSSIVYSPILSNNEQPACHRINVLIRSNVASWPVASEACSGPLTTV